jgi:hypothetical protein
MARKAPPVPPENRSKEGTGSAPDSSNEVKPTEVPENTSEQGRQRNIRQNTRNQGYQQDR